MFVIEYGVYEGWVPIAGSLCIWFQVGKVPGFADLQSFFFLLLAKNGVQSRWRTGFSFTVYTVPDAVRLLSAVANEC